MLGRILAICLALMTACYSPPQPDCGFACGRSGECPSDYFCAPDGICHRNGTAGTSVCAIDARIDSPRPIDAIPPLPDADTTPPTVFMTDPADTATNVPVTKVVEIQFNEPVSGVTATTFHLEANSVAIAGTVTQTDPFTATFAATAALPAATMITVYLESGIRDGANNALVPVMFSFTTAP